MQCVKSGIENPSKSEVIGRCGGDEKNEWPRRTDKKSNAKKNKKKIKKCIIYEIKESFHSSYQSIVCFARLLFRYIYIDKMKVDRVDLTFTTTKNIVSCICSPVSFVKTF